MELRIKRVLGIVLVVLRGCRMPQKKPKHVLLVYGDGTYKGYNINAFLAVCKIQFETWKDHSEMKL